MLERRRRKHHIPDEDDELRSRDLGAALLLAGDLRRLNHSICAGAGGDPTDSFL